jgi:hypothetical protein
MTAKQGELQDDNYYAHTGSEQERWCSANELSQIMPGVSWNNDETKTDI